MARLIGLSFGSARISRALYAAQQGTDAAVGLDGKFTEDSSWNGIAFLSVKIACRWRRYATFGVIFPSGTDKYRLHDVPIRTL